MNNPTLQVKIKQRLNKLDSNDYDNIECWQIVEAFNKAQIEWCRRQLHGTNARQEGDEMSKKRIDDLEILLTESPLTGTDVPYNDTFGYFQSNNFESIYDNKYLEFKRIRTNAHQIQEIQIPHVQHATCPDCEHEFREYLLGGGGPWFSPDGISGPGNPIIPPIGTDYTPGPSMTLYNSDGSYATGYYNFCRSCNYMMADEWTENGGTLTLEEAMLNMNPDPMCNCCDTTWTWQPGDGIAWEVNPTAACIPEDITTYTTETVFAPGMDKEKCCEEKRSMTTYLSEVGNVDIILRDSLKNPDFEWCETFCTLRDHEIRIWRKDFWITDPYLIYYRKPINIQIEGCIDPYTGIESVANVICEFKDDIVENMLDDTISIIAGDISDANNLMRGQQQSEKNN